MDHKDVRRYPLSWPLGWKRTPIDERHRARFSRYESRTSSTGSGYRAKRELSLSDAIDRLALEMNRLGGENEVLSSNVKLGLRGNPLSGAPEPADTGVAVYFTLNGKPRSLACDRWNRVADNVAAIAGHIAAMRTVERYGVGTMDQAFAGYAQLPPSSEEWWLVLGISRTSTLEEVEAAFRSKAKEDHPDAGGSADEMVRLNRARSAARAHLLVGRT